MSVNSANTTTSASEAHCRPPEPGMSRPGPASQKAERQARDRE